MSPIFKPVLAAPLVILAACSDQHAAEGEDPFIRRDPIILAPGTTARVNLYDTPPFSITTPPDPDIASALIDSSGFPPILVVSCHDSATDGKLTYVAIEDGLGSTSVFSIFVDGSLSYSDDIQPIWDGHCQNRDCHPGGGAPFSLDRFVSWSNLWFAPVTNTNCGAIYRVVGGMNGSPGNPDSSLVYLLVSGQTSCPRMPFSTVAGDTLSASDQNKIKLWILQGAQNN